VKDAAAEMLALSVHILLRFVPDDYVAFGHSLEKFEKVPT
jgi:hypothetical protein